MTAGGALGYVISRQPTDTAIGGSGLITGPGVNNEFDAVGIDLTYYDTQEQCRFKDTVTAANNYRGPAQGKLTYTSPSVKRTRRSDGLYAATNGTTELPFEWLSTGELGGLLSEPAATNLCLQSSDFTNASWTKVTMTTAKTATGPDGVANSASTLTASGANATAKQAIVSASALRITSMFVKRRTGTGNIDISQDNGTVWTTVTTTTAWTRVQSTSQTLTNPTVGIRIVTSADAIDVAWFQHELGDTITSPINTTTGTVTRAVDNITLATSAMPFSTTVGTLVVAHSIPFPTLGDYKNVFSINDGTANEMIAAYMQIVGADAGEISYLVQDGGATSFFIADIPPTGPPSNSITFKVGATWQASNFAVTRDGATPNAADEGAGSLTIPTVTTWLITNDTTSGSPPIDGYICQLVYYKRRLSDTELQTVTR